ncbi:MAG: Gfo/Idh/MocA family oxidoreductase, partial [Verrucomicrobia bacterium]|nr:Gfo/Idh/MocA family oxidoreductase [Verrucomicrobiota bacterium]
MAQQIDIGIIGCGNISHSYLKGAAQSELVRVKAVTDLRMETAQARAAEYGVQALPLEQLLADPDIEIVINLTVPLAHAPVSLQIVEAGKHLYSEKPLGIRHAEAEALMLAAKAKGVRVGCAPDTFLGAGHQACRRAIDAGRIGRPIAGSAFFATHGVEHWHPNPEFFFKRGGGPVLDMGPYYVTQLVNLLGPVARVAAQATMGSATRTVSSEPLKGSIIQVEVPTTVNGVLLFANGASVTITTSWDVWKHRRLPFELYGSEGSMLV